MSSFTAVTQRLLEHSSPQLTNDAYTNVDPVLRQAVERLPVAEWVRQTSGKACTPEAISLLFVEDWQA